MGDLEQMLRFVAPEIPVLTLPAWDCLPYDRVSPSTEAAARRIAALTALIEHARTPHPAIVLVSVNALVQKAPPRAVMEGLGFTARAGSQIGMDGIIETLQGHGFERVPTVREVGEYAVRGGILDVYVPGADAPLRLDFFGNTLETVRSFDPATQRTVEQGKTLDLHPMSEVTLTPETISRFRTNYLASFGAATRDDALYQAISEGRRFAGMEHWLPLFYEELETTFDYLRGFIIVTDHLVGEAAAERYKQVEVHYDARRHAGAQSGAGQGTPYKPVEPASLYVSADTITQRLDGLNAIRFSPFDEPETGARRVVSLSARPGPRWARQQEELRQAGKGEGERSNVFDTVVRHIAERRAGGSQVLVTGWSEGSLDRLLQVLGEHGLERVRRLQALDEIRNLKQGEAAAAVLNLESGFETGDLTIIGEQDILGDRLVRRAKRKKRGADYISEVAGLDVGSIVVHAEHGIARFVGLKTIEAAGCAA
jgi:transcription-repair coupling factor (superfamily II helicase)